MQNGILLKFAVEIVTVRSMYNVALDSLRGQSRSLEQDRWHDTLNGLTAFAEVLKSNESGTTPPVIAWLYNITYPPP